MKPKKISQKDIEKFERIQYKAHQLAKQIADKYGFPYDDPKNTYGDSLEATIVIEISGVGMAAEDVCHLMQRYNQELKED